MHGGLSPELTNLWQLKEIKRPTEIPEKGLLCDLTWSDPDETLQNDKEWGKNERGVSVTFSAKVVEDFCEKHDYDLICRAHEVVEPGYVFFANRKLVTLFSAPNYSNNWDNAGAVMHVDENLKCSFSILPSEIKRLQKLAVLEAMKVIARPTTPSSTLPKFQPISKKKKSTFVPKQVEKALRSDSDEYFSDDGSGDGFSD